MDCYNEDNDAGQTLSDAAHRQTDVRCTMHAARDSSLAHGGTQRPGVLARGAVHQPVRQVVELAGSPPDVRSVPL